MGKRTEPVLGLVKAAVEIVANAMAAEDVWRGRQVVLDAEAFLSSQFSPKDSAVVERPPESLKEVSRKEFVLCPGVSVVEIIYDVDRGVRKLVWVRDGMEKMVVLDRPNPCFYDDYYVSHPLNEHAEVTSARDTVRAAFIKYWNLSDNVLWHATSAK